MNRKQRIFSFLEQIHQQHPEGVTTKFIADQLNLSRANVSNQLNVLVKEKLVNKSIGRPVNYFIQTKNRSVLNSEKFNDSFNYLIGGDLSLKNPVKQAKAAIMYPPSGLHTLITGNTGVGKSLFAKLMYNYAIANNRLSTNKPFVIFNCADYANNPQLLISQIFGYVKGSFTGAVSDKQGLIAQANGGMLFLDEVHRLPPEGQEMIFYFIDTGTYGLLGETQRKRKSQVFLVCATTEDPDSTLLATFLRRIPIKINLPNLDKRTPEELIALTQFIFENESHRIKHSINVDSNSVKAILGASFNGNVGKLKSNIQTVCALSLVDHNTEKDILHISFAHLPADIKSGLFNFDRNHTYQMNLNKLLSKGIFVDYNKQNGSTDELYHDNDNVVFPIQLHNFIDNQLQFMLDNHFSEQEINHHIVNEVNRYVNFSDYVLQDHGINETIIHFCNQIKAELELYLQTHFSPGFTVSLACHIENIIKQPSITKPKEWIKKYNISSLDTYDAALLIKLKLEKYFKIRVDIDEVTYLAILISSLKICNNQNPLYIIVAAHGGSIATEMVNVAKKLISEENITAVDMPLNIQPQQAIRQIKKAITAIPNRKGILLLVDMGSLKQAADVITSDIPIKTLDMVSTPLVIEALRLSVITDMGLNELYYSLKRFRGYGEDSYEQQDQHVSAFFNAKPYAILAICSSGEGIAQKLKRFLQMTLEKLNRTDIFVLNVSVDYILSNKTNIIMEYNLLASIGVIDPQLNIPHLYLDELLSYKGDFLLQTIINTDPNNVVKPHVSHTATTIAEVYLQDFLIYLNPKKILPIVIQFIDEIKTNRLTNSNDQSMLSAYIHICCALERTLKKETIIYNKQCDYDEGVIRIYQNANKGLADKLGISLDDHELFYVIDMLEKN